MMLEVIDRALRPTRTRPLRFYTFVHTGGSLAEYVLQIREWWDVWEEPDWSVYAVQELSPAGEGAGEGAGAPDVWEIGRVFVFQRVNPLPPLRREYDDGEDGYHRLFRCSVPCNPGKPGKCDCKGWRTFKRCKHLEALRDVCRLTDDDYPVAASELEEVPDSELFAWVLGEPSSIGSNLGNPAQKSEGAIPQRVEVAYTG